jgi:hypothetical protein
VDLLDILCSSGELGNAVQDAFVIAVEQQARERLQRLSALKRITPIDMSQLSIKLNQQSQAKGGQAQDLSFLKEASPIYVTSLTGNHVTGTTTLTTTSAAIVANCLIGTLNHNNTSNNNNNNTNINNNQLASTITSNPIQSSQLFVNVTLSGTIPNNNTKTLFSGTANNPQQSQVNQSKTIKTNQPIGIVGAITTIATTTSTTSVSVINIIRS